MGNNMKNEARPPRRLAYTWHCSKTFQQYCRHEECFFCATHIYADGPQFSVMSPAEKYHKTNAYLVGPFAQYLCEVLSVVSSHVTCGFCETSKNKKR